MPSSVEGVHTNTSAKEQSVTAVGRNATSTTSESIHPPTPFRLGMIHQYSMHFDDHSHVLLTMIEHLIPCLRLERTLKGSHRSAIRQCSNNHSVLVITSTAAKDAGKDGFL